MLDVLNRLDLPDHACQSVSDSIFDPSLRITSYNKLLQRLSLLDHRPDSPLELVRSQAQELYNILFDETEDKLVKLARTGLFQGQL